MKDIRPMAEERARKRAEEAQQERPPGSGFMTERARAKEALRAEVSTLTGENVRKIAAAAETRCLCASGWNTMRMRLHRSW